MAELDGMGEVLARLQLAAAVMAGPAATQTERQVASDAVDVMRGLAPVLTGELRDSIDANDGEIVAASPHAAFVEFGTSDTAAQPFFRPALQEAEQDLPKTAQTIYRRVVPGLD